ncbi:unnamed protein product [Allacma fusca]|uniref:Dolichyl-diphosphooligosaccharide--protein glycosyltransferase subunit 2 n=1 Tax=Allacma fusca TaxID=39272 RepID=A0A8J2LCJ0_9HEXA|nr:unnamed protein product [Allacma fusca]
MFQSSQKVITQIRSSAAMKTNEGCVFLGPNRIYEFLDEEKLKLTQNGIYCQQELNCIMRLAPVLILLLSLWAVSGGDNDRKPAPTNALSPDDLRRIKAVLEKGLELKDPLLTSYSVLSNSFLGVETQKGADVCKYLLANLDSLDGSKIEPVFANVAAISKLTGCKVPALKAPVKQVAEKLVKEIGGASQEIFYAAASLKLSGTVVDGVKLAEVIKATIKTDDSPQSLGYALWATALAYKSGQKLDIWERIEDIVAQADEVDKQFLQFEGGLSVTAIIISGIFRIAEAANKPLPLTTDQVIKFGNYLVSRKTVTTPRGVFLLASALDVISKNKYSVPVYLGLAGSNVLTDANRVVTLRGSDLLGRPLDINVVLESAVSADGKKAVGVEFIQALPDKTDKTLFTIDLKSKPLSKGFFTLTLVPKSAKNEKNLILQAATVQVKQVGKLGAVSCRVGVQELDQQDHVTWTDLNKGQRLPTKLDLEPAQKLVVRVTASDSLHQVFVLLRHKETKREVAFIAQPETSGKTDYKLELDLTSNAKDLNYQSGSYEVVLYLGDFLIEDSTEWVLGDVQLTVFSGKPKSINQLYSVAYGPKPEIKHQFRVPEPRPPRFLSDTFTLLVLAPILILLILWAKIGVNISGFPASISALGFHLGLAGIFGVYATFWLKLSMFEALKIMTVPGLITFISGHRLLSFISERRTKGS